MVKGSTFTQTLVTTLVTGSKGRCKVVGNYLTVKEIWSMKVSGKTTISKVKGSSTTTQVARIGSSTRGNSGQETRRVLGSYFTRRETGTRVSSGTICTGAKGDCSTRAVR
jgi:hypothetical protein